MTKPFPEANQSLPYSKFSDIFHWLGKNMEKAMAPHSSTLAWKIPWMEELGRLRSMGSLRVGNDWATSLSLFTFMHWRRKWQPTPVFLPGESQGRGSLLAAVCRITQSWTRLKWLSSSSSNVNMNFSREKIHSFHRILKEFYRPEKNKIKDGKQLV